MLTFSQRTRAIKASPSSASCSAAHDSSSQRVQSSELPGGEVKKPLRQIHSPRGAQSHVAEGQVQCREGGMDLAGLDGQQMQRSSRRTLSFRAKTQGGHEGVGALLREPRCRVTLEFGKPGERKGKQ